MILKVTKQKLELDSDIIAEGAINYATFELQCDISWRDFSKTVRFVKNGKVYDLSDVEEGRSYYLPHVILNEGTVWVGVVGVSDGNRVATTEKAEFHVKGAIESGNTPVLPPDAYAKYVNEVTTHRKRAEMAEQISLECLKKCERLMSESENFTSIALSAKGRAEEILKEASGILDAVGMAFRDIREIEEALSSVNSRYSTAEQQRDKCEKARAFTENKRALSEDERRQRETEREAAEIRRNIAEQVRSLNDARRDDRLNTMETRLAELEAREPILTTCISAVASGENELVLDAFSLPESITIYGATTRDGKLHGVGEEGFVTVTSDGSSIIIPISEPLYSVGETADSVTVTADGEVTVCRRTAKVTLDGSESYTIENMRDGSVMYITPLITATPQFESVDIISSLEEGNIRINGDYLFICFDADLYPNIPTLAQRLKDRPVEIIYPVLRPYEKNEGSVDIDSLPSQIEYGGRISVKYKKDLFKVMDNLKKIIDEKEKKDNENT